MNLEIIYKILYKNDRIIKFLFFLLRIVLECKNNYWIDFYYIIIGWICYLNI